MHPVLFAVGPFVIYTYGFFVCVGVLVGYWACLRSAVNYGIDREIFSNIFLAMVIAGFIGAKLLYILIEFKNFLDDPISMIRSGFVFYGGIITGAATAYYYVKKYSLHFFTFADICAAGLPLAHAFGRLGCFSYGCCYGRPTSSALGIIFPAQSPAGGLGKVIPTQLIEAIFLFILFILLIRVAARKKFNGQVFLLYVLSYGFFRFIIEFFRADSRGSFFILSTSQAISLVLIFFAIVTWSNLKQRSNQLER